MSIDQLTAEKEAAESLIRLLEHAKRCQTAYERAHMALPEPLKRLLGHGTNGAAPRSALSIPAPPTPPMPTEARPEWIWIRQEDATTQSVVLAILREAGSVLRVKDLSARVFNILPDANQGSINNIGTKLDAKHLIERDDNGWRLLNHDRAGILYEGYLWAPKHILIHYEVAAHRRYAILHLLNFFPGGLQTRQILEQLRTCAWMSAPLNKDLLKADLELLSDENKIRRVGNSGKWELVPSKDTE